MAKVRIKKLPEGYKIKGGKVTKTSSPVVSRTGDQSDFGLVTFTGNSNVDNSGPFATVNKTLSPEPRDRSNLEAERGETALTDLNNDGAFELYNIGGNRHSSGGTPLNLPPQSFIYSDTRSMKLNKNELLEMGIQSKKKITPAKVSKKYDLNDYIALLNDPNSDHITVDTAEYMLDKNKNKLSQLAFIQERKKEFDEGVPMAAYPYIKKKGADPIEFSQAVENISKEEAIAKSMMQMPASMQEKVMQLQQIFDQIDAIKDPNQADIDKANRQEIAPHQEQSPPQLNPIPVPPMEQQNLEMMARYGRELPQAGWGKGFMDKFQSGLSVVGMIPGVGNIADAANTAISGGRAAYAAYTGDDEAKKKHLGAMALNATAMIPGVGQMATAAKGVKGAKNIVKAVGDDAVKYTGEALKGSTQFAGKYGSKLKDVKNITQGGMDTVKGAGQIVNLSKKAASTVDATTAGVDAVAGTDISTNLVKGTKKGIGEGIQATADAVTGNNQPGAVTPPSQQMAQNTTTPTAPPPVTAAIPGMPGGVPGMPAVGPQAAPTATATAASSPTTTPAGPGASIAQAATPPATTTTPGATAAAQSATATATDTTPGATTAATAATEPSATDVTAGTDETTPEEPAVVDEPVEEEVTASAEPEEEYVPQSQRDEESKYGGDPFSELKSFVDGEELEMYQLAGETDEDELSDEDQEKQEEGVNVAPRKQGEFQYDEDAKWIRDMMRDLGYNIQDMNDLGSIQGIDQQSGIPDSEYFADEEATSKWMMSPEGQKWHYENNKQSFANMGIMNYEDYQDQYVSRGNDSTMVQDFQSQHAKGALNAWDSDAELREKMIAAYGDEETAKQAYMQSVTFGDHGKGNPFGKDNKHGVYTQGVSDFKKSPMEVVCIKCSEEGKQISQVFSKKDGCGPGWFTEGTALDCAPPVEEVRELDEPDEVQPVEESDPEFWLQDQLGLMNAIDNKFRIKKYYPWAPRVDKEQIDAVFQDPTREIAAIGEQAAIAAQTATAFSGPQRAAAVQAKAQGVAAQQIADTMARTQGANVQTANIVNSKNVELSQTADIVNKESLKKLYDDTILTEQNYDNALKEANAEITKQMQNMYTNRAYTHNLNQLYPEFNINPQTGGIAEFDPSYQGDLTRSTTAMDGTSSQGTSVDNYLAMYNIDKDKLTAEERLALYKSQGFDAPNQHQGAHHFDNRQAMLNMMNYPGGVKSQRGGENKRQRIANKGAELRKWFSPLRGKWVD